MPPPQACLAGYPWRVGPDGEAVVETEESPAVTPSPTDVATSPGGSPVTGETVPVDVAVVRGAPSTSLAPGASAVPGETRLRAMVVHRVPGLASDPAEHLGWAPGFLEALRSAVIRLTTPGADRESANHEVVTVSTRDPIDRAHPTVRDGKGQRVIPETEGWRGFQPDGESDR